MQKQTAKAKSSSKIGQYENRKSKFCEKVLSSRGSEIKHMKKFHAKELNLTILECKLCDSKFTRQKRLDAHLNFKHSYGKSETFECDFDGKIFKKKNKLCNHMLTHMGTEKCKICHAELKKKSMYVYSLERFSCK